MHWHNSPFLLDSPGGGCVLYLHRGLAYNGPVAIVETEALRRLEQAVARVDAGLSLDRAAVRVLAKPYQGVEYGLRLRGAGALLFLPEADLTAPDWETRLFRRVEAAKRYLEGFPQGRARQP